MPHKYLLKEFQDFARSAPKAEVLMQHISERIHMHIPRYNWVGFYLFAEKDLSTLVLGPHAGSFTPNPKISQSGIVWLCRCYWPHCGGRGCF